MKAPSVWEGREAKEDGDINRNCSLCTTFGGRSIS